MDVALVYLIKGNAQKYQQNLIKKIAYLSKERYIAFENPLPQHVTLMMPFKVKSLKRLDSIVAGIVKEFRRHPIKINGFGNFKRFVVFLRVDFPNKARKVQRQLVESISREFQLVKHEHDMIWKPHATLAYGNTKSSFSKIWKYLKTIETPKYNLRFDNIAILKKPRKYWKIHRIYRISRT